MGETVHRNLSCLRTPTWPTILPEEGNHVLLQLVDAFPLAGSVFTDGSVCRAGGAAAVRPEDDAALTRLVQAPRSSTHCKLMALLLALAFSPTQIVADSLAALTMLRNRGQRSAKETTVFLQDMFSTRVTAAGRSRTVIQGESA